MKRKAFILKTFLIPGIVLAVLFISGCIDYHKAKVSSTAKTEEIYTCSMHPQVIEQTPGRCPICGMALVKKENAIREISKVDLSTLLQPTNSTVLSAIPVTKIQSAKQQLKLDALGSVEYDTRFMKTISARVSGRISKLYIRYRYQPIHAGDKVMEIYSPELVTAQQNLLFLVRNDPENTTLIGAARQKLLLLGVSQRQVQKVVSSGMALANVTVYSNYSGHVHEAGMMINSRQQVNSREEAGELTVREGMYVEKGQPVFQVNNMENVWISLNLFPGESSLVTVGTPVTIIAETDPAAKIDSKIGFIEPFYRDNAKTVAARVYFNNSKLMIPVGSRVKATLTVNTSVNNWLPQEAVLSLGLTKVVFLKDGNVFKVQPVSTGISANNMIQITGGLNENDNVAANAQFLVDSEGFIKIKK